MLTNPKLPKLITGSMTSLQSLGRKMSSMNPLNPKPRTKLPTRNIPKPRKFNNNPKIKGTKNNKYNFGISFMSHMYHYKIPVLSHKNQNLSQNHLAFQ
jgi:hypothetical protein